MQELTSRLNQLSNPNLLINGDFQIWQRGDSFDFESYSQTGYIYTADRWCIYNSGTRALTCNKVEEGLQFTCENDANALTQWLERRLENGETYVLSAKINGNIETLNITGGTDSDNSDYLAYYADNATHDADRIIIKPRGTTTVSWVKLEKGNIATLFVSRLYGEELTLCQRFYQNFNPNNDANDVRVLLLWYTGHSMDGGFLLPAEMRVKPKVFMSDVAYYSYNQSTWVAINASNVVTDTIHNNTKHFWFQRHPGNQGLTATAGDVHSLRFKLALDAEIY